MLSTYFFLSAAVFPWYIIIPLSLSIFTNLKFPLVWSIVVFLSYSFYDSNVNVNVKSYIIVFEYITVMIFAIGDYKRLKAV